MPLHKYVFSRYQNLFDQEEDSLVKTTIKILFVCLISFIGLFASLVILYLFQERNFLLIRACILFFLFALGLALLVFKSPWTIAAHVFTGSLTLLIWSNVLFFPSGLTIITVQYTLLVMAAGYYMLGIKWGVRYSLINILPLIGEAIIDLYFKFSIPLQQFSINKQAYTLTICFNFMLLLYVHYSFFRALKRSKTNELRLRTDLQKSLLEAQELATAKTNFLTTMSHELRTPLNAVVGMTNILIMENPRAGQKENLKVLKFSAENLMASVNDILDFNKINNEKIILEEAPFKFVELIGDVMASFKPLANEKKLQLEYMTDNRLKDLAFLGDRLRIIQILFHLVGNAIKFTENGFVRLDVMLLSQDAESARIHLKLADSGIGIPEEMQARIFEPFSKSLSRTSRQFHGALGLTIAYQLIKIHNSELRFQSQEGQGTTFEFELSYPLTTEQPPAAPAPALSAIEGLRVLVVEDEKLNILVLKKILSKWGITPDIAMDGQQAVDRATESNYDAILMDINMPVMDGLEASKQIKSLPGKAGIPIIAVTASIGAAVEQVAAYPFIDDCLLKPFDPEHLREKLMQIAGRNVLK